MTQGFLPYGRQEISDADVQAVAAALREPMITQGPRIEEFEVALAQYLGARHVVAYSSGTAALHGAAFAAAIGPGDEAIVAPITFVASANCIVYEGGTVRFVDIDPATWNLDTAAAAAAVGPRTKAVVAVSFAGLPVDLAPLRALGGDVVIIEDACHALGGHRDGVKVGGPGGADITCFSLHPVKSMTSGEGGFATTEDDELAARLRRFRTHGIEREQTSPSPTDGPWYMEMQDLGFNYRITDFQCALGLSQLRRLDGWVARRNEIAALYRERLGDDERLMLSPAAPAGSLHGHHLFVVGIRAGAQARLEVFNGLRAAGLGVQVHYLPVYRMPYYRDTLGVAQDACPHADAYYDGAISLPMYPGLTDADVDRVASELQRLLYVKRTLTESERLLARAQAVIPAQTQTLSKNNTQWARGAAPLYVARASGAHVWDVDGHRYVDFPMALGPVILGHAWPAVNEAIARQLADGITYTLPHPIEIEVAERVVAQVPGAERVRFGKTGSDANSAAIRIARTVTGRDGVLAAGYHGWHDWFIGTTTRDLGIPAAVKALTRTFDVASLASLDAALAAQAGAGGTAAVILEPAGLTEPTPEHLQAICDRARAAGALVIFDEIITGFRLAPGGAQERYGVRADLVTFGKALGNGMPISAVAGPAGYMDTLAEIFFSATHGGEALSMAAALATMDEMTAEVYAGLESKGLWLRRGVEAAIAAAGVGDWVSIDGAPQRTVVVIGEPEPSPRGLLARTLVQQEMALRGVLFNGNNFICAAHSPEDLEQAVDAYAAAFLRLAEGIEAGDIGALLSSEPVQAAFRVIA